jgi:hypothetical protein
LTFWSINPHIFNYQQLLHLLESFWVTQLGHTDAFENFGTKLGATNANFFYTSLYLNKNHCEWMKYFYEWLDEVRLNT